MFVLCYIFVILDQLCLCSVGCERSSESSTWRRADTWRCIKHLLWYWKSSAPPSEWVVNVSPVANATMNQRVCDYSCYCCFGPLIHLAAGWIPSSAAAGGRTSSYGCRSVAVLRDCCSHSDSFVFGFAIVQERLPGEGKRHGRCWTLGLTNRLLSWIRL